MTRKSRRRNTIIIITLALIVILVLLLLGRCERPESADPVSADDTAPTSPDSTPQASSPTTVAPPETEPDETLTPAVLQAPAVVSAGAAFTVTWIGPNNPRDFIALARKDAPAAAYASYRDTGEGDTLEFTAPVETGDWEMRYVAGRSRTVLARVPVAVTPVEASLYAAAEVPMGAEISVAWTGPDNDGDYITIVPQETPDGRYGNYTETAKGSPLTLKVPPVAGEAELRYMTGQDRKVIGRRPIRIVVPEVSLSAPATAVAGSTIEVSWTGPNNAGDYITLVERERPDGQYGNYVDTSQGSPVPLLVPMISGEAELRYMTGQGARVLARRPITLLAVEATLSAPAEVAAGAQIPVTWTGPNYPRDYITVVPANLPDGQYRAYVDTTAGSPLNVKAPEAAGDYELRYMTGQGAKVIARRSIRVTP